VRTPKEIIFTLIDCATKQSNFLLNASPRLDGSFPEDQRKVILEAGEWIRNNGEAIYGVNAQSPRNMITSSSGRFALKNKKIYFYVYRWPTDGNICMGGLNRKINRIFLLSSGQKLSFKQNENRATINSLPERDPDKYCSVIVME